MRVSDAITRRGVPAGSVLAFLALVSGCAMPPQDKAYRERLESGFLTPQDIERFRTPDDFHRRLQASARDTSPGEQLPADQALMRAAADGDLAQATVLLAGGARVNTVDAWGNGPLLLAAREGHATLVRALVAAGAHLNGRGGEMPPLAAAALRGHEAVVRLLLRQGADPDAVGGNGQTALLNAVKTGRLAVAGQLLDAGADTRVVDRAGDNLLIVCVSQDRAAMLDLLLRRGVQPDMADGNGLSALYWAEFLQRPALAARLRLAGADPDRRKVSVLRSRPYATGVD